MDWFSHSLDNITNFFLRNYIPDDLIKDHKQQQEIGHIMNDGAAELLAQLFKPSFNENHDEKVIETGSTSEGLSIPSYMSRYKSPKIIYQSDFDKMKTLINIYKPTAFPGVAVPLFEVDDSCQDELYDPRYIRLRITEEFKHIRSAEGVEIKRSHMRTSTVTDVTMNLAAKMFSKGTLPLLQGPSAMSGDQQMLTTDNVTVFEYPGWPVEACEWIHRPRSSWWPDVNLVQQIITNGCHIAPVGRTFSPHFGTEWRISFSLAERDLAQSLTTQQRKAFIYLKMLKDHTFHTTVISTYHLKNIFFYACEKIPSRYWEANLAKCLNYMLCELISALVSGKLQHYLMPGSHLLKCVSFIHLRSILQSVVRARRNIVSLIKHFDKQYSFLLLCNRPEMDELFVSFNPIRSIQLTMCRHLKALVRCYMGILGTVVKESGGNDDVGYEATLALNRNNFSCYLWDIIQQLCALEGSQINLDMVARSLPGDIADSKFVAVFTILDYVRNELGLDIDSFTKAVGTFIDQVKQHAETKCIESLETSWSMYQPITWTSNKEVRINLAVSDTKDKLGIFGIKGILADDLVNKMVSTRFKNT